MASCRRSRVLIEYTRAVAYFLFNYTAANAKKGVPLRKQAAALLDLGLWGIGEKTQNRKALQSGDQIVAYVGAPERAFVGRATLASAVHPWAPDEKQRYPLTFGQGVAFSEVVVWDKPVPLHSVWGGLTAAKTNPKGVFQGGVARLVQEDYEAIVAVAGGAAPKPKIVTPPAQSPQKAAATHNGASDALFDATERLKKFLAGGPKSISEDATRAHFINRYLEALGYTEFEDIDYGAPVDSGDFADYVLRVNGEPVTCVEAKKLGAPLGEGGCAGRQVQLGAGRPVGGADGRPLRKGVRPARARRAAGGAPCL